MFDTTNTTSEILFYVIKIFDIQIQNFHVSIVNLSKRPDQNPDPTLPRSSGIDRIQIYNIGGFITKSDLTSM
jgi:hypothetical protein